MILSLIYRVDHFIELSSMNFFISGYAARPLGFPPGVGQPGIS
jgi:hypothetical protein